MARDPDDIPMERIAHESGIGDRFTLLVYTKATHELLRKYGGDSESPLYGPQARRLRTQGAQSWARHPAYPPHARRQARDRLRLLTRIYLC